MKKYYNLINVINKRSILNLPGKKFLHPEEEGRELEILDVVIIFGPGDRFDVTLLEKKWNMDKDDKFENNFVITVDNINKLYYNLRIIGYDC